MLTFLKGPWPLFEGASSFTLGGEIRSAPKLSGYISCLGLLEQNTANRWLKRTEIYSLPGLEAGHPESRCPQGRALSEGSRGGSFLPLPTSEGSGLVAASLNLCHLPASLCLLIRTPVIGLGARPTPA